VNAARERQTERFKESKYTHYNAQYTVKQIKEICRLGEDSKNMLKTAMERLNLSARVYDRILKVPRTISDLEGKSDIQAKHIAEANSIQKFV